MFRQRFFVRLNRFIGFIKIQSVK